MTQRKFSAQAMGLAVCLCWLGLGAASPAWAGGDLLVTPTRLVFEGKQRTAALSIVNTGNETATYRISFIRQRMTETGDFKEVRKPAPGERFADEIVTFFPKEVQLSPGEAQTLRLRVRRPADLENGEYRSHLLFRAVPRPEELGRRVGEKGAPLPGGLKIQLIPIYGVAIPVIVRQGETSASADISHVALLPGPNAQAAPRLALWLHRTGNRSVYGDLVATFLPERGAEQEIGRAKGVAVYTPNEVRRLQLPLKPTQGLLLRHGVVRVKFEETSESGGKASVETSVALP